MWADTLLNLERGHLLRLGLWAAASILAGGLLLLISRQRAPFVKHVAIQLLAWGCIDGAFVAGGWKDLALRDYASAMQLQDFLWLNVGLDAGYIMTGITVAVASWTLGKRLGGLGAGVGVVVQGLALLVLDLRLLTLIESARIALLPARTGASFLV